MTSFARKHGRAKPPRISSRDYDSYQEKYGVIGVWSSDYKLKNPWHVDKWCDQCADLHSNSFPTHAEAVTYAHKLAPVSGLSVRTFS